MSTGPQFAISIIVLRLLSLRKLFTATGPYHPLLPKRMRGAQEQ